MATTMRALVGGDIPLEYRHLKKIFRVVTQDGSIQYFETGAAAAKAMSKLVIEDRIKNG